MEAEYIVLCDAIITQGKQREITGGVAVADGHILRIGERKELSEYLGIDTQVIEYHNSTLFIFEMDDNTKEANIAVVSGNSKRRHGELTKMVGLRFLMCHGNVVIQKNG